MGARQRQMTRSSSAVELVAPARGLLLRAGIGAKATAARARRVLVSWHGSSATGTWFESELLRVRGPLVATATG
jgi:hypothetical protein